uniref:Innexin n=1 Tax=Dugesia japonica TaxID=6161 RepID=Q2L6M2_DUGJA|nr:innexin1 [Dugesia japonica]
MVFNTSFLAFIQGLKIFSLKTRRDDDYCDRLSHHHTAMFLLITSILISSNQYVGNPIHCWVPKEFSDPWQKYANNYCWIKNTYVLPPNLEPGSIPKLQERGELEINYYQWVPIVLLCQSLLFYLPSIIWRMLNWTLGINVQELVTKAMDVCTTIRPDVKKEESTESNDKTEEEKEPDVPNAIKDIAHHLELSIDSAKNSKSGMLKSICNLLCCGFGSRKYGFYLITLYLTTITLYR